jgi:multiple sugar transport system permease protein
VTVGVIGATQRPGRGGLAQARRRFGWWLLLPTLAVLAANSIFPILYALRVSFESYQMLIPVPPRFLGLANYAQIMRDPLFWHSLQVTLVFVVGVIVFQFPAGFGLALLVNRLPRFQELTATLLLLPTIMSASVVGFQWYQLYNYEFGPVNYLLGLLHLGRPTWTADPHLALPALVFVDFWEWTPFMTLLLFAGLRSLPGPIIEAARVDGSTPWEVLWRIIVPLLRPVIGIAVILRVIMAFKLFDIVYVLTAGGPGIATENVAFYTYIQGFRYFNMGLASALSILQLILITILAKVLLGLTRRPLVTALAPEAGAS